VNARAIVIAGAAVLFGLAAACEAVIGADFGDVQRVSCGHAGEPARPNVTNAGGTDEITVALTKLDIGDGELPDGALAWRTIGRDLDGVCDGQGARPSCTPFGWASPDPTDGIDGRDNNAGALMHAEKDRFGISPFTSKSISDGIADGGLAPVAI